MRKLIVAALGVLAVAAVPAQPGMAIGEGEQSQPKPQPTCKKGYVYSPTKNKCVRAQSEAVPDADQGWALAAAGDYEAALELFRAVSDPRDPEALNGLGFTHRKLGLVEEGIRYYRQAIAIDPDYVRAREYLGEGYVALGKLDLAKTELAEIEKRCGRSCQEYLKLSEAIAGRASSDW